MEKMPLRVKITFGFIIFSAILNECTLSYDPSMINAFNSLPVYSAYFNLDAGLLGLNVAVVSAGSIIGAPLVGPVSDRWGRRRAIMIADLVTVVGGILQVTATAEAQFAVGRFLIGISLVIAGTVAPTWVMELSPANLRGAMIGAIMASFPLVSVLVIAVVIGVLNSTSIWAWRGLIFGEIIASILGMVLIAMLPESPRWLIYKGREEEALTVLANLHARGNTQNADVLNEFQEVRETIEADKAVNSSWINLVKPLPNLKRFMLAVLCNIFFQVCGVNNLVFFLSIVLSSAGVTEMRTQFLVMIGFLVWSSLGVMLGSFLVERVGRMALFLGGTTLMIINLALLALLAALQERGISYSAGAIAMLFLFQFFGSCSWMILQFAYPVEILKFSQRAKGVAAAQGVGYAFSFISLYTLPIAIQKIGWKYYAINAGWNLIILGLIYLIFVETNGKTLEEIDSIFEDIVLTRGVPLPEVDSGLADRGPDDQAKENFTYMKSVKTN